MCLLINCFELILLAGVVQMFHLIPYAIARSLVSQQMGEDEQGTNLKSIIYDSLG